MAIEVPRLPFEINALEPHISRRTLEFHYGKHHMNYVKTLNELIKRTPFDELSLEEIMQSSHKKQPKIYNNAAQVWNHSFMWNCLAGTKMKPHPDLEVAITKAFGSMDGFKEQFLAESKGLFGSGWTWLVIDRERRLHIRPLPNAENPLQAGETPLFTCDVWEHAYYLDYQNERPRYLESYWSIVNWDFVGRNWEKLKEDSPRQNEPVDKRV